MSKTIELLKTKNYHINYFLFVLALSGLGEAMTLVHLDCLRLRLIAAVIERKIDHNMNLSVTD